MTAKQLAYWDYDRDAALECECGWSGVGADNESYFDELLDVRCPSCSAMLLIVAFPTIAETQAAAASGNRQARAELLSAEARETRLDRAAELELLDPSQLPDLSGTEIRIEWGFETIGQERWTVLRYQNRDIWRELAYYEGYRRFAAVFEILRQRYGSRLVEVRPTAASETYLYGDKLSAPRTIQDLNERLRG